MQRLHLVELEDLPWLPRVWRDGATDLLDLLFARLGMYRPVVPALVALMNATGARDWLDLCSGGGGGALAMRDELAVVGQAPATVTLTDRYPNDAARQRVAALDGGAVTYRAEPVDALHVPGHPPAIRTMFGALHHFPPDLVRGILQDAVAAGVPVAFVDVAASPTLRRLPTALALLASLPNLLVVFVVALVLTPLTRSLRPSRLFWTYVVPAIPLLFAWDGTVSALRAYTPDELLDIARSVPGGARYEWQARRAGQALSLTGYARPVAP